MECIAITTDNKYIVSGSGDCTARVWSLKDRKEIKVLHGHSLRITSIVIAYCNKYIVSVSDDETVRVSKL